MATGGLTPLRGNNAQVGWFKQSAWGTGGLPTAWWMWRKGTSHRDVPNDMAAKEGDAGRWENLAWRQDIYGDYKIAEAVRPRTIGCSLQAFCGDGSDAYVAPTKSTTLAANVLAGATTISSTADLGNLSTLAVNLTPGVASQTYEVVTLDLTTRTGAGPYVYTLAASGTCRYAHTSADALTSASTHVFTPQTGPYAPYATTFYRGNGSTAPFQAFQYGDSVCYDWSLRSGPAGAPLMAQHSWYARYGQLIAWGSPAPVLEGIGQTGLTGGPFSHNQAKGSWSLNSVTTGNAVTIDSFTLAGKNTTNVKEFLTEDIYPAYFTVDNTSLDIQLSLIFQTWTDYYNTYFGGISLANTKPSGLIGYAPFAVTYTMDAVNSLAISVPWCRYVTAEPPVQDENAGIVKQTISLRAMTSATFPTPFTITLGNSQAAAY